MSSKAKTIDPSEPGEPVWDIARLFPAQGAWSEADYLALDTNHLVEFSDGRIEVLPMPTQTHQAIVAYLFTVLLALTRSLGGAVYFAPLPVRLWPGKFREPDLMFMLAAHTDRRHDEYWDGADLVMEVVSGSVKDRRRDLVIKRDEYARAGIPVYWIVDPEAEQVTVLRLSDDIYVEHGQFSRGMTAASALLPDLRVSVDEIFQAASA